MFIKAGCKFLHFFNFRKVRKLLINFFEQNAHSSFSLCEITTDIRGTAIRVSTILDVMIGLYQLHEVRIVIIDEEGLEISLANYCNHTFDTSPEGHVISGFGFKEFFFLRALMDILIHANHLQEFLK